MTTRNNGPVHVPLDPPWNGVPMNKVRLWTIVVNFRRMGVVYRNGLRILAADRAK